MSRRDGDDNEIERPNRKKKKDAIESDPTLQQAIPSSYGYSTDLGKYSDPNYTYQEGDEMNDPGPEPPRDSPEWPVWKAHAKAWRNHIGQRQAWVDAQLSMGATLEDLGIRDVHEEGRAGYRRRALMGDQGMVNQGWEYDWAGGRKRNTITSDATARDRWIPIKPEEYKEREYARSYGGGVEGYTRRLQSEQQNRFGNVMREGGPNNGITKNSYGVYVDPRPDGTIVYRDSYGATTDEKGNRIGGSYDYDGKGTIVTNRAASSLDTEGAPNTTARGPVFSAVSTGARTFGNPNGTPALKPTNQSVQATYRPQESRPFRRENSGQGYGRWGSYYGAPRPAAGPRIGGRF